MIGIKPAEEKKKPPPETEEEEEEEHAIEHGHAIDEHLIKHAVSTPLEMHGESAKEAGPTPPTKEHDKPHGLVDHGVPSAISGYRSMGKVQVDTSEHDRLMEKKKALEKYSMYAQMIERDKREAVETAAEREQMGEEDAMGHARRKKDMTKMHPLGAKEVFFWNAIGVPPAPKKKGPAHHDKKGHPKPAAPTDPSDQALSAVSDAASKSAKGSYNHDTHREPTKGHHLPVAFFGNHNGLFCVVVPRPDRASLYNKLFFTSAQLHEAEARARARHKAEHDASLHGLPAPTAAALAKAKAEAKAEAMAFEAALIGTRGAHAKLDAAPEPPADNVCAYVWEHLCLRPVFKRHAAAAAAANDRAAVAIGIEDAEDDEAGACFTGDDDEEDHAGDDKQATLRFMRDSAKGHQFFPDAKDSVKGGKASTLPPISSENGRKLKLKGVDAFSTDPAVDQRASAAIMEVVGHETLETRALSNKTNFQKVKSTLHERVKEEDEACASLAHVLDQTGDVVEMLRDLNEKDGKVLSKLYASSIFEKPHEEKRQRAALYDTHQKARYKEPIGHR